MKKYNHSFMIARFQPLHNGHKMIIDKMLQDSKNITIILGSAQESGTELNPLSPEQRLSFVENLYGKRSNMKTFFMKDLNCDADTWYKHVMNFLKKNVPQFGFPDAYYCGDMVNGNYYNKGEVKIEVINRELQKGYYNISATEIRNMIRKDDYEWKNYIPKENHLLVEKYFKDLDLKSINNENINDNIGDFNND